MFSKKINSIDSNKFIPDPKKEIRMKEIAISIIIPVYQAEAFISNTIETVLRQTFRNFELILVDDGSTDLSGHICDEYAKQDIRIKVIHQENKGQSAARNTGINAAQGKYIAFMDHDDEIYPEMYYRLYENAEKYAVCISAVSYSIKKEGTHIVEGEHTGKISLYNNIEGMEAFLTRKPMDIYVWTKIYRRKFIEENNLYFEVGRSDEDFLYNYAAFCVAVKTVMNDIPLYLYSNYSNSTHQLFYKKHPIKYFEDTWYRLMKIENGVKEKYPNLHQLAKFQTVRYCFRMLFIMSKLKRKQCEPYYSWIKKYFYSNTIFIIRQHRYWHMTFLGAILAACMPATPYFWLKKKKHQNDHY